MMSSILGEQIAECEARSRWWSVRTDIRVIGRVVGRLFVIVEDVLIISVLTGSMSRLLLPAMTSADPSRCRRVVDLFPGSATSSHLMPDLPVAELNLLLDDTIVALDEATTVGATAPAVGTLVHSGRSIRTSNQMTMPIAGLHPESSIGSFVVLAADTLDDLRRSHRRNHVRMEPTTPRAESAVLLAGFTGQPPIQLFEGRRKTVFLPVVARGA